MKSYLLKHKEQTVCRIQLDATGMIVKVGPIENPELLPLGGNLSADALRSWWVRRAVPITQKGIKGLLFSNGKTAQKYLSENLGLSMTDHYWICPEQSEVQWGEINFYEHSFEDMSESVLEQGISSYVPGASTQGDLKKKWMIGENGGRYLLKENEGTSSQQSLNEILATEIHRKQGKVPYTAYHLVPHPNGRERGVCCVSQAFTNSHVEFISAYDLVSSAKKPNDRSYYEHFITLCGSYGLDTQAVREFLEYQILTDFIITNTDRHFRNFGVLRDSDTLQFLSMAPIFDSGNSMFWNYPVIPQNERLYEIQTESFKGTEMELLKYVKHRDVIVLDKLPNATFLYDLYSQDFMREERLQGLIRVYQKKKEMTEQFLLGKKLVTGNRNYLKKPKKSL